MPTTTPVAIDPHERAAVKRRLAGIAAELTFPKLTSSQAASLNIERMILEQKLANARSGPVRRY